MWNFCPILQHFLTIAAFLPNMRYFIPARKQMLRFSYYLLKPVGGDAFLPTELVNSLRNHQRTGTPAPSRHIGCSITMAWSADLLSESIL